MSELPVLVTGANSGIGLATAIESARAGFRTVGTVRSAAKADVLLAAAEEAGVEVETALLDVTDADGCEKVLADLGTLRALVNNAGYALTGAIEDIDDDEGRALMETMVIAPTRLARLAVPGMREAGGGHIVNVSSVYGRNTTPLTGWYQGAKHALEGISDALRMEVAGDGIHVVLIEPGGFDTNIWEDLERDVAKRGDSRYGPSYRRLASLMQMSAPLMGDPEQCAKVIVRAIRSDRPRARYMVGVDARMIDTARQILPTPVLDRVMRLAQGL